MSFEYIQKLPTVDEIKETFPLTDKLAGIKNRRDKMITDVLKGKSDKFLVIVGPCSADNEDAVVDYVTRLGNLNEKIKDKIVLIPRVYTDKPRTTGVGYKGITSQPDPAGKVDFRVGLMMMRHMLIRVIKETGLTAANEMLYPEYWGYVSDVVSYMTIGARSVEDQEHRITASGFDIPTGMKNPISGALNAMLNSVYAAQQPHSFIYRGYEVKTNGNKFAHCVLRGFTNTSGQAISNYHYENLRGLLSLYNTHKLQNPAVIIDANHDNSNKQFKEQIRIVKDVLHSRNDDNEIHRLVKGVMIESYIEEGSQRIGEGIYGKSITDPCLGWKDTERLILDIADAV